MKFEIYPKRKKNGDKGRAKMEPYVNERTGVFDSPGYLEITKARLDHLASMNIPLSGKSVIDVDVVLGD